MESAERSLLAIGALSRDEIAHLSAAAQSAALALKVAADAAEATTWLEHHLPHALLVDTRSQEPQAIAIGARAPSRHSQVPALALVETVDDLAFASAFSWGAEDVIRASAEWPLITRLRALPKEAPSEPVEGRGVALIADADPLKRIALGRVLRNAGYSVSFAMRGEDLAKLLDQGAIQLVVADESVCDDPRPLVEGCRRRGVPCTWIVTSAPRELRRWRDALDGLERATATDGFAPPENVLFLSNELSSPRGHDQRKSARILYGTTVAFRGAGRAEDDLGYTYNVSGGGMYVRTLAPPDDDVVWLELCAPRSERRVRLEAKIAWRRRLTPNANATVPPGFGAQIADGAKRDLDAWQEGYASLVQTLG